MPGMIERRCNHSLVVVRNKLFAIGGIDDFIGGNRGYVCELFDSTCKKFVNLNSPAFKPSDLNVISIGSKIFVLKKSYYYCYDVEEDKWSKESWKAVNEVTKNIYRFTCVKIPMY